MDDKDERVHINTFEIMSNPTIKWDEVHNRKFHISDVKLSFMDWLWHRLPIKERFHIKMKIRENERYLKTLPYRLPRMIRGIGWRIKNMMEAKNK